MTMQAVRAHYENGQVKFEEKPVSAGPAEVIVIFPDDDPWEAIINDPSPRPALVKAAEKAIRDHKAGKTKLFPPDFR